MWLTASTACWRILQGCSTLLRWKFYHYIEQRNNCKRSNLFTWDPIAPFVESVNVHWCLVPRSRPSWLQQQVHDWHWVRKRMVLECKIHLMKIWIYSSPSDISSIKYKYDSDLDLQIAACLDLLDVNDGESPLQHGHQYFATGSYHHHHNHHLQHGHKYPATGFYRTSSNHLKIFFQEHHNIFSKLNPDEYKQVKFIFPLFCGSLKHSHHDPPGSGKHEALHSCHRSCSLLSKQGFVNFYSIVPLEPRKSRL